MPSPPITRFAPSPTGLIHLGHAYSAWLNHDRAVHHGGRFILRIEDIDQGRSRPEYEQSLYQDLAWLGLKWDTDVWRQSERIDLYRATLDGLQRRGLLYRCFKTRAELSALASAPHGPEENVPITAPLGAEEEQALLETGRSFAWRLHVKSALEAINADTLPAQIENPDGSITERSVLLSGLSDPVLARKDFPTSYHLASIVDDAAQGINLVWRGTDLEDALPLHRLLQALLALPAPTYRHHALIMGPDGKRLAKRDRGETIQALRESGATPAQLRQRLGLPLAP